MDKSLDEIFNNIASAFIRDPKVSQVRMFGSPGLKISGKVFAFLMKGKFVLKLPKEKVDELVVAKEGKHFGHMFAPGNWRPMKEWVEITSDDESVWLKLAQEAKDFVSKITQRNKQPQLANIPQKM